MSEGLNTEKGGTAMPRRSFLQLGGFGIGALLFSGLPPIAESEGRWVSFESGDFHRHCPYLHFYYQTESGEFSFGFWDKDGQPQIRSNIFPIDFQTLVERPPQPAKIFLPKDLALVLESQQANGPSSHTFLVPPFEYDYQMNLIMARSRLVGEILQLKPLIGATFNTSKLVEKYRLGQDLSESDLMAVCIETTTHSDKAKFDDIKRQYDNWQPMIEKIYGQARMYAELVEQSRFFLLDYIKSEEFYNRLSVLYGTSLSDEDLRLACADKVKTLTTAQVNLGLSSKLLTHGSASNLVLGLSDQALDQIDILPIDNIYEFVFTVFHEFGHLIMKDTQFNNVASNNVNPSAEAITGVSSDVNSYLNKVGEIWAEVLALRMTSMFMGLLKPNESIDPGSQKMKLIKMVLTSLGVRTNIGFFPDDKVINWLNLIATRNNPQVSRPDVA